MEQQELEKQNAKKPEKFNLKNEIISWIKTLAVSVLIVLFIITFIGRMMRVDGSSMEPTLHNNDRIITTNLHGELKHGDIVVIKRKDDTSIVKRIIALQGDKIDIDFATGDVYLNDKLLDEPYIFEKTDTLLDFSGPVIVPEGKFFVMGDNRNHSDDSRSSHIGLIDKGNIFGKVVFRVFPLDNFGTIK